MACLLAVSAGPRRGGLLLLFALACVLALLTATPTHAFLEQQPQRQQQPQPRHLAPPTAAASHWQQCQALRDGNGALSLAGTSSAPLFFDVRDFGALPDEVAAVQTEAIASAIDAAAASLLQSPSSPHAYVYLPPGQLRTGSFNLTSNVFLCLADGSQLVASDDASDYVLVLSETSDTGPFDYPLIGIFGASNTGIIGSGNGEALQGAINGGLNSPPGNHISRYDPASNFLYPEEWKLPFCGFFSCRPKLLVALRSTDLIFTGASLLHSAFWTLTLSECDTVLIDSMVIRGDRRYPNNDAIDVISTSNVQISNSLLSTGDDNIALITHTERPVQNVTMRNLQLSSTSSAIHVAIFDAGASGAVRDVIAENCMITDSNRGITISPRWGTGSVLNLHFTNISIETRWFSDAWWGAAEPIHISSCCASEEHCWNGTVSNILFERITTRSENGAMLYTNVSQGLAPMANITFLDTVILIDRFSNQTVRAVHDLRPSLEPQLIPTTLDGIYVEGADELVLENTVIVFAEPAVAQDGECLRIGPQGATVAQLNTECLPPAGSNRRVQVIAVPKKESAVPRRSQPSTVFRTDSQTSSSFLVVGYFGDWYANWTSLDLRKLDIINYCAVNPTPIGGLEPLVNATMLSAVVEAAHAVGTRVFITVGGPPAIIDNLNANVSARAVFVANILQLAEEFALDGIDVDFEFPTPGSSGSNFRLLMEQLGSALHGHGKLLSAAVVAYGVVGEGYEPGVLDQLDLLHIMDYDNTDGVGQSTFDSCLMCMRYWSDLRGMHPSKVTMGVPFYADNSAQPDVQPSFADLLAMGASPHSDTFNGTYGYNSIDTIGRKVQWASGYGIAGIMIWEMSLDVAGKYCLLDEIERTRPASSARTSGAGSSARLAVVTDDSERATTEEAPSPAELSSHPPALCPDPSSCFSIANQSFVVNGAPIRIVSGSIHYWRSLPSDWADRLRMVQLAGLNTITLYVHWALHQPEPTGGFVRPESDPRLDFVSFIKLAGDLGLYVIVRVGPYITAEVDFGGFPYWIQNVPGIAIRRPNAAYYALIDDYFDFLVPYLVPLQYNNGTGGPIIDFQIEDDTDVPIIPDADTHAYYSYLLEGLRSRGIIALVNVLAWPSTESLSKAIIPGAWTALEYAVTQDPVQALQVLRQFDQASPPMVMEIYPAWLDTEGNPHHTINASVFASALAGVFSLSPGSSVSIYPIFGGTNFGFTAGSDFDPLQEGGFASIITSYDYDTAVIECGDAHPTKFMSIRETIEEFLPVIPLPGGLPAPSPKGEYGLVSMNLSAPLLDNLDLFQSSFTPGDPETFEALGQAYGYVLYRSVLTRGLTSPQSLLSTWMMDRGLVYLSSSVESVFQGVFGWAEQAHPLTPVTLQPIAGEPQPTVAVLVENKGRCSGTLQGFICAAKGMRGPVYVGVTTQAQQGWNQTSIPLDNMETLAQALKWKPVDAAQARDADADASASASLPPTFYRGSFSIGSSDPVLHSYLQMTGWYHGFAFVNGFNLGRFTAAGPARCLYVPAEVLQTGENQIIIFESDSVLPLRDTRSLDHADNSRVESLWEEPQQKEEKSRPGRTGAPRTVEFVAAQSWTDEAENEGDEL